MERAQATREHLCERCGKAYASHMRLQHHLAADHAVRTLKDIRTSRDVRHAPTRGGA